VLTVKQLPFFVKEQKSVVAARQVAMNAGTPDMERFFNIYILSLVRKSERYERVKQISD